MKFNRPVIIGGLWFFLGLIYSSQSFFYSLSVGREYVWQRSLFHSFVFCIEWGFLTPLVLKIVERFRLDAKSFRRNLFYHFSFGLVIAFVQQLVYVYIVNFVDSGFQLTKSFLGYFPSIIGFFEFGVLIYWAIVFMYHAIGYYHRYQQEEKNASELRSQLVESQLQALKMQLQPHFLFNTLNAIFVLVKKEPSLAQKMIVRLSDLLRLTLERGNANTVSLEQELEFLNTYLAIEKVRFGDRLSIKMNIEESALSSSVPTFLLQPLVENSIRHGLAQRAGDGWIEISSEVKKGKLFLSVEDGGTKSRRKKENSDGIGVGLENTKQRLKQLYGDRFNFEMRPNEQNGFSVRIEISV